MSVLACSRHGCENVMCDRYSDTYGYICEECFSELEVLSAHNNIDIAHFMQSKKVCVYPKNKADFLKDIFKL